MLGLVKGRLTPHMAFFLDIRILSSLVTCLDSFVFLESEYHFTDALLSLQADCNLTDSNDVERSLPSLSANFVLNSNLNFCLFSV